MKTVPIPPWNAQGVLPPIYVTRHAENRQDDLLLLAERIVLERMLAETPEADVGSRANFQGHFDQVERRLAEARRDAIQSGADDYASADLEVDDEEQTLAGEFQGVLPTGREFEFQLQAREEVIHGYVSQSIADPDKLNKHLHCPALIKVIATRVGSGPPCFVLIEVSEWLGDVAEVLLSATSTE